MTDLPPIKYLVGELVDWVEISSDSNSDLDRDPAGAGARMADLYRLAIENYDDPAYRVLIEFLDERDVVDAEISMLTEEDERKLNIAVGRTFIDRRGAAPLSHEQTLVDIGAAARFAVIANPEP